MSPQGYAVIKADSPGVSGVPLSNFYNDPVRVIEFARDGGVMVIDRGATGVASFDREHVVRSFKSTDCMGVLCPPGLQGVELVAYATRCLARQGGYNRTVRALVVAASLHRGEFTDSLLWAKQGEGETVG